MVQTEFLYKSTTAVLNKPFSYIYLANLTHFCCFDFIFDFFSQTHGYAWFLPILDLFLCRHLLAVSTNCRAVSNYASCFTVTSICLIFLKKETTLEPKKKQQAQWMCVLLKESVLKRHYHFEIHLWIVCVGLGCPRKEPQLYSNVLQSRQFYFSIENVLDGCLVQE